MSLQLPIIIISFAMQSTEYICFSFRMFITHTFNSSNIKCFKSCNFHMHRVKVVKSHFRNMTLQVNIFWWTSNELWITYFPNATANVRSAILFALNCAHQSLFATRRSGANNSFQCLVSAYSTCPASVNLAQFRARRGNCLSIHSYLSSSIANDLSSKPRMRFH